MSTARFRLGSLLLPFLGVTAFIVWSVNELTLRNEQNSNTGGLEGSPLSNQPDQRLASDSPQPDPDAPVIYNWHTYVDPEGRYVFYYPPSHVLRHDGSRIYFETNSSSTLTPPYLEETARPIEDLAAELIVNEVSRATVRAGPLLGISIVSNPPVGENTRCIFFRRSDRTYVLAGFDAQPDIGIFSTFKFLSAGE